MKTRGTSHRGSKNKWLNLLLAMTLISLACNNAQATDSKSKYVHIPMNWLRIQIPKLRIKNVGRLLARRIRKFNMGKNVVIKPGDIEIAKAKNYSGKRLKLLRDLSFNGITLKKGCLIALTDFPSYPAPNHAVQLIECQNSEVVINGKHFSGVFHDFETGIEGVLAPTLDPIVVKESFKLPNGQLIKAGTRLDANSQWFPDHATNSLRIVESPRDQE